MKICRVALKNLNSLKGEVCIDFEAPPLGDSGLYAITGATGAGKTTLLDAITVALYNKVPRHDGQVYELMSRHTSECWSEVVFEAEGKRYRSKWSLNRAHNRPDGRLQPDKMELAYADTGELLGGHRKLEILSLIVEITGLTYEQFLRSVMLAQGDFAKFLKASPNERSKLLEQMTDIHIFTKISSFVYEKAKTEKSKLEQLDAQLGSFQSLDEAAIQAINAEIDQRKTALQQLNEDEKKVLAHLQWWQKKYTLNKEEEQLKQEKNQLEYELSAHNDDIKKFEWHQKALPAEPVLERLNTLSDLSKRLDRQLNEARHQIATLNLQLREANENRNNARKNLQTARQEKTRLSPLIEEAEALDREGAQKQKQLEKLQKELETLAKEINAKKTGQEQLSQHFDELKKKMEALKVWMQTHANDAQLIAVAPLFASSLAHRRNAAQRLNEIKDRIEELENEKEEKEKRLQNLREALSTEEEQLNESIQNKEAFQQVIAPLLQGTTEQQLLEQIKKLPEEIACWNQLFTLAKEAAERHERKLKGEKAIEEVKIELGNLKAQMAQQNERLTEANQQLNAWELLLEKEKQIDQYKAERMHLVDGEACPLCGALHHPYAMVLPDSQLQQFTQQVHEQQSKIHQMEQKLQAITQEKNRLEATLRSYEELYITRVTEYEQKRNAYNQAQIKLSDKIPIENLQALENRIAQLNNENRSVSERWETYQNQKSKLNELDERIGKYAKIVELKKVAADGLTQTLVDIGIKLAAAKNDLADKKKLYGETDQALHQIMTSFDWWQPDWTSETMQQEFDRRKNQYTTQANQFRELQHELALMQQRMENTEEGVRKLSESKSEKEKEAAGIQQATIELSEKRKNILGCLNTSEEKTRLHQAVEDAIANEKATEEKIRQVQILMAGAESTLAGLETQLHESANEQQQLNDSLLQLAVAGGFADSKAMTAALLPRAEAAALENKIAGWRKRTLELNTLLQKNTEALQHLLQTAPPAEKAETLEEKLQAIEADQNTHHRILGMLEQQLQTDAENKRLHAKKIAERTQQLQVYQRWDDLNRIIGSADGNKFRSFAQGLTLQHLTALANRHLRRFSDRYELHKKEGDNLELAITDLWQAGISRPVTSLSGGETFLASLALALGLSDLASNKIQIQSLFIDEGFGTLDAETLDIAMDALENLRESGKSVGVISHMEAMKERIHTQIQVKRLHGGISTIAIQGSGA